MCPQRKYSLFLGRCLLYGDMDDCTFMGITFHSPSRSYFVSGFKSCWRCSASAMDLTIDKAGSHQRKISHLMSIILQVINKVEKELWDIPVLRDLGKGINFGIIWLCTLCFNNLNDIRETGRQFEAMRPSPLLIMGTIDSSLQSSGTFLMSSKYQNIFLKLVHVLMQRIVHV